MTLPVNYNPQNDYEFTIYEPYKYSNNILSEIYQGIRRLNLIKQNSNLQPATANYLEAIVLTGLIASSKKSVIANFIPNILGETLRLTEAETQSLIQLFFGSSFNSKEIGKHYRNHAILSLYNLQDPSYSLLKDLSDSEICIVSELFKSDLLDIKDLINNFWQAKKEANFFLVYDPEDNSFEQLESFFNQTNQGVQTLEIKSFNLLESLEKITQSTARVKLILISKTFAESRYNPEVVLYEALQKRKIEFLKESTFALQKVSKDPFLLNKDISILIKEEEIDLSAKLFASYLNEEDVRLEIASPKLDRHLLEINQLETLPNLDIQINSKQLSDLSINLLLQYVRREDCNLKINYHQSYRENSTFGVDINYHDTDLDDLQNTPEYLFAPGEDFTILTWGGTLLDILKSLSRSDQLEPEIILLKQIWPLPVEGILQSVARTSRLIVIPDPKLSFPLVDVYCNQLASSLYRLLDAPLKVLRPEDLSTLANKLDSIFYEN